MSKISRLLILSVILLIATACGNTDDEPLPTLAIVPSPTASDTPTITPSPTATETLTPTATPTNTLTFTPTLSPTNTLTFTPTLSATPTTTATFTQTFTPTATNTATQTFTPTATNTPEIPVINSFTASTNIAPPGSQVTLSWTAQADAINLQQVTPGTSTVVQSFVVPATGSQIVTLPTTGDRAQYRLVANRGGQQTIAELLVNFSCTNTWFFAVAAPGGSCPSSGSTSVVGSFQSFERGIMFMYTNRNGIQRICGLQNQNNRYLCYDNGWDGTSTPFTASPPSGFHAPDDMFNWAFDSTLASGGTWLSIIGWGTVASANTSNVTTQYDNQNRLYIRVQTGTYFLNGDNTSGTWTKIE